MIASGTRMRKTLCSLLSQCNGRECSCSHNNSELLQMPRRFALKRRRRYFAAIIS